MKRNFLECPQDWICAPRRSQSYCDYSCAVEAPPQKMKTDIWDKLLIVYVVCMIVYVAAIATGWAP